MGRYHKNFKVPTLTPCSLSHSQTLLCPPSISGPGSVCLLLLPLPSELWEGCWVGWMLAMSQMCASNKRTGRCPRRRGPSLNPLLNVSVPREQKCDSFKLGPGELLAASQPLFSPRPCLYSLGPSPTSILSSWQVPLPGEETLSFSGASWLSIAIAKRGFSMPSMVF